MSIVSYLESISDTKSNLKNVINIPKTVITNSTVFSDYPKLLKDNYVDIINNGTQSLYDNFPKKSNIGSNFILNNTYASKLNFKSIISDTYQPNYTGKNLFDFDSITSIYTFKCTAVKDSVNKTITFTSSASNGYGIIKPMFNFELNKKYTISFEIDNMDNFRQMYLFSSNSSTAGVRTTSKKVTFTRTGSQATTLGLGFYPYSGESIVVSNIQIEENNTATEYEPYTGGEPAPSESFSIPINCVSGSQTVIVKSKNLFDKTNYNVFNGYIDTDDVIKSLNTAYTLYYEAEANKTYTISREILDECFSVGIGSAIPSNELLCADVLRDNGAEYLTVTTDNTNYYIYITLKATDDSEYTLTELIDKIQIEEGNSKTSYVDFAEQSYPITLGSIKLCSIGEHNDVIQFTNNKWIIENKVVEISSYAGETIETEYISSTGGLDTGANVYYVGDTELEIDEINYSTLYGELEDLKNAVSYDDKTFIYVDTTGNTYLPLKIEAIALSKEEEE